MLRRLGLSASGYYNFLKDRKAKARTKKAAVQRRMVEVFHKTNGTIGSVMMMDFLAWQGVSYSITTIKKYMKELH